ncbi:MAG: hypothetical protein O3B95_09290, partial [Chloroflexi bacterium]|nr:hypothetical protein [Chloroflexota bacterium]
SYSRSKPGSDIFCAACRRYPTASFKSRLRETRIIPGKHEVHLPQGLIARPQHRIDQVQTAKAQRFEVRAHGRKAQAVRGDGLAKVAETASQEFCLPVLAFEVLDLGWLGLPWGGCWSWGVLQHRNASMTASPTARPAVPRARASPNVRKVLAAAHPARWACCLSCHC